MSVCPRFFPVTFLSSSPPHGHDGTHEKARLGLWAFACVVFLHNNKGACATQPLVGVKSWAQSNAITGGACHVAVNQFHTHRHTGTQAHTHTHTRTHRHTQAHTHTQARHMRACRASAHLGTPCESRGWPCSTPQEPVLQTHRHHLFGTQRQSAAVASRGESHSNRMKGLPTATVRGRERRQRRQRRQHTQPHTQTNTQNHTQTHTWRSTIWKRMTGVSVT